MHPFIKYRYDKFCTMEKLTRIPLINIPSYSIICNTPPASSVADIESGKSQEYTLTKSSGSGSGKLSYVTEDLVFVLLLLLRSEEADEDRLRDLRNSTLVKVCVVSVKFPLLVLAEEVTSEISEFTTQHSTKPLPTTSNIKEHDLLNDDKANGYSIGGSEGGSGVDDHEKKIWRDESMIGSEKDETGGSIEQIRSMTKESANPNFSSTCFL
ncbi:11180_t:CDS:2 [Entrophospora sp. SA101]|nr:11180_t:CDS:2 [Entrophospora sp. SA101]